MAYISKKHGAYYVVYYYKDEKGYSKQKWEKYKTSSEAKKRKIEVEFQRNQGTLIVPQATLVSEMLAEFVYIYGTEKWALSTYQNKIGLIENYINPYIGKMKIEDVTTRVIENYYKSLRNQKMVTKNNNREEKNISPKMINEIHRLLRCAFNQAVKWEMIGKNPCSHAIVPKAKSEERIIWDCETLLKAIELCKDPLFNIILNVTFAASLREGELLGLTWDCVFLSDNPEKGASYISIEKELQRVRVDVLDKLSDKDVLYKFDQPDSDSKTILILKTPKTESSIRKIYLPRTVAEMLKERQSTINKHKEFLGSDYCDYNLVFCSEEGKPLDKTYISRSLNKLIKDNGLPKVVFHSLRHSSIHYKLLITNGDIKSVQGDSGHSQAKMVTDVYSHILDKDRQKNADLLENMFFNSLKQNSNDDGSSSTDEKETNEQTLLRLLADPKMASILKAIADNL